MDGEKQIADIKAQLGITDNSSDEILLELFLRYLSMAKLICLRKDEPPEMIAIVKDITAGAYNQRGGEGFSSSGAGSQSYVHVDLHETMRARLVNSGLRVARF